MKSRVDFQNFIAAKNIGSDEISYISNQISVLNTSKENYIIAMYTITIMIIGFALEYKNNILFILPYLILFSFQRIIDSKKYNSLKYCAYLASFTDVGWERFFDFIEDEIFKPSYDETIISRLKLVRVSSLHLGLICSLLCSISVVTESFSIYPFTQTVTNSGWILIGLAWFLFFLMIIWTWNALDSRKARKRYVNDFKVYFYESKP